MMMFSDSWTKFQQTQAQREVLDKLTDELERADSEAERQRLREIVDQAAMMWDILCNYVLFSDHGEWQDKFIWAEDYDDKVPGSLARFYACPHSGHYYFNKIWKTVGLCWYCWLNFDKCCELADLA